jgi:xylose dehydrogenase (NAD/NADP)
MMKYQKTREDLKMGINPDELRENLKGGKIKWGILGGAAIAENRFIPSLLKADNSELYAIASRNNEKITEYRKKFKFQKAYTSYEGLLADQEVQAVYIPLPNGLHKEWTIKAAQQGKHVLCEKPFALNVTESQEMINVSRQNNVKLMEAYMYRYSDRIKKVREILASGVIGEVKHIISYFGFFQKRQDDYRLEPKLGGGSVYDVGGYIINFISMVMQDYPESVTSELIVKDGIDIAAAVIMKYKSGVMCTLNCWFNAFLRRYSEIIGTKGLVEIPNTFFGEAKITVTTEAGKEEIEVEDNDRYLCEIEDFANAVINNREPLISLDETVKNMKIIEQILSVSGNK